PPPLSIEEASAAWKRRPRRQAAVHPLQAAARGPAPPRPHRFVDSARAAPRPRVATSRQRHGRGRRQTGGRDGAREHRLLVGLSGSSGDRAEGAGSGVGERTDPAAMDLREARAEVGVDGEKTRGGLHLVRQVRPAFVSSLKKFGSISARRPHCNLDDFRVFTIQLAFYSMLEPTVLKRDPACAVNALVPVKCAAPNGVSKIWEVFALAKVSFTSKNCSECKIRVGGGANSSALFPAWNPKKD
ncbi:hypothetical protein EJB05_35712, partial [Eragrostis curvula]